MIRAYLLAIDGKSFPDHKWDFGFVKEAFDRKNIEYVEVTSLPKCDKAFVVICGFENKDLTRKLSEELSKVGRVVLFVTGDESGSFMPNKLVHNNMEVWVQSPYIQHKKFYRMPIGCPSMMKENIPKYSNKVYDVFFSGQITHSRRKELADFMPQIENSLFNPTPGFTQGYSPKKYYKNMSMSKIIPAPAGTQTIDSFRLYEAIEMLCIPIADTVNSLNQQFDFWSFVFGQNFPIPKTENWAELEMIKNNILENYPENLHKIVSWWIKYKRDFANKIMEQVNEY